MSQEIPPEHLQAMEKLYNQVVDSPVTDRVINFLTRTHLLLRIADHDVDTVGDVVHEPAGHQAASREYDALTDPERAVIAEEVTSLWAMCVSTAIRRLWHACGVLEIDPRTLTADQTAVSAATLLSARARPRVDDEPVDGQDLAA